jgi:acetyl esterase/lipase
MPVLDRIDPEFLPILRQVPIIDLENISAAREALHAVYAATGAVQPDPQVTAEDRHVPGLPGRPDVHLRLFRPADARTPLPCLYWIQGGGYVLSAPDLDDAFCQEVAKNLHCVVASVGWRRAPEAPYPAAHEDCLGGLRWLFEHNGELSIDPARIILGGASSGGGAAAGVALRLRDEREVQPSHLLLIYPMLDDREGRSSRDVTDPELWNAKCNRLAWAAYLGDLHGTDDVPAYAAPARASSLAGLPPTTLLTGELDLFVDENLEFARRLIEQKVSMELHCYPAVHHGFNVHNPTAAVSQRFAADRDDALKRAMWGTASPPAPKESL